MIRSWCNSSSYHLIQAFLGPIRAGFYQAFTSLFGAMPNKYHELAEFLYNRYGVEKGNEILGKCNVGNLVKLYV